MPVSVRVCASQGAHRHQQLIDISKSETAMTVIEANGARIPAIGLGTMTLKKQLSIAKGIGGHYWVAGSVNGQSVQFLVDTGATSIALNDGHARRLGIDYRVSGRPLQVSTASGTVRGWQVSLDRVKVGELEVLGVDAVVLEGGSPTEALLGMSFLGRIGWRVEQDMLVLESKY
jgi:aspartyl protease family protein